MVYSDMQFLLAHVGLFSPVNLFLSLVKQKQQQKVYLPSFAILGNLLWTISLRFFILGEYCDRYERTDKKLHSCVYYRIS